MPSQQRAPTAAVVSPAAQSAGEGKNHAATVPVKAVSAARRRSRVSSARRAKNGSDEARKAAPSGAYASIDNDDAAVAASKAGRQFTVASIGTNGMIYLRSDSRCRSMTLYESWADDC